MNTHDTQYTDAAHHVTLAYERQLVQARQLSDLWNSTAALIRRFYGEGSPGFEARLRVLNEEFGEFVHAAHVGEVKDAAAEAIDLLVTALGVLQELGCSYALVEAALGRVIAKNDAKTHETHTLNANGKIARKGG